MNVVGLDLSLTSTGIAYADGTTCSITSKQRGAARLADLRNRIVAEVVYDGAPNLVAVEGYSYGSVNGGERIGELGGVIRVALFDHGIPYVEVSPNSVKLYAAGVGNADKDKVLSAAVLRAGFEMSNDEADAWWLRAMTLDFYGEPPVAMPAKNRAALSAVVKKKGKPAHPAILWPALVCDVEVSWSCEDLCMDQCVGACGVLADDVEVSR